MNTKALTKRKIAKQTFKYQTIYPKNMRKRNKRGAGKIKIRRQKNTGLVVAIILILAAAMFAAQLNPNPTGKTLKTYEKVSDQFGECHKFTKDPYPPTTTKYNCCYGYTKIHNYKWVSKDGEIIYC